MSTSLMTNNFTRLSDIYNYYIGIFNLSFGLLGNLLIIILFVRLKLFRGNPSSFYLIIESVSNILIILSICPIHVFRFIHHYDLSLSSLIVCKLRLTSIQTFAFCSLYTVCWCTFDQYLSTHHRYSLRNLSSMKFSIRLICATLSFILVHNILLIIFVDLHPTFGCNIYNSIIRQYFSFFFYPILSVALPIFITTIFSLFAYRNVRRIVRRQIPLVRRRLDRQMTALVLGRVISIIICGLPYMSFNVYQLNTTNNTDDDFVLIGSILYSILYTNFSMNFYLFLFVSSRFRRQVKRLICTRRISLLNPVRVVPDAFMSTGTMIASS